MNFSEIGASPHEKWTLRKIELEIDKIRWGVRMWKHLSIKEFDYAQEMGLALTVRFAQWPETGTLTVSEPATWWDHLKKTLQGRYPRALRLLSWTEKKSTYEARLVIPNVDLPPELEDGSFAVFSHGETTLEKKP